MQNSAISEFPPLMQQSDTNAWAALDAEDEWSNFSQLQNPESQEWYSYLVVDGMRCAACAISIEQALNQVPGVVSATVSAGSNRARIVWRAGVTKPSHWMRAVSRAGYRLLPAADAFTSDQRRRDRRKALWRWLVAGFCMMQVMMYALPAYVAGPGEMTSDMFNLLRWASWVLTLPVLFFSCGPFFNSALSDLKHRRISMDLPVAIGILITFLVSTAATFEPTGWWGREVYFDSLTMFVFFLLTGRWLELRLRDRTAGALEALMQRLPATIERQNKDGSFSRVSARRLVVGDVIRVFPGEAFPADGTVILGSTNADEALLTGESRPVFKATGAQVITGSHNLSSLVEVRVEQVGTATRFAEIVALMEQAAIDKPRLAKLADRIAKPFLIGVLLAAGLAAAMLWQIDPNRALMAAVAVLIVTCPCALSLATPAAMLTISGALAKRGVLVRRMQALEALAGIDTIIFDKTGTLTMDHMNMVGIRTAPGVDKVQVLQLAAGMAMHSLHPLSKAIARACDEKSMAEVSNVVETSGFGLSADTALGKLKLGSARYCGLPEENAEISKVHLVSEQGWLANFMIEEEIKECAFSTVSELLHAGFQVEILSGDHQFAVEQLAAQVGITEVYANCTPSSKLAHIQHLQQQGRKVLMVGDGLNDGPVLAAANVSVAMGLAVPLAQAQSDFVVLGGQLSMVPQLISDAKRTLKVVRQNLLWAAIYNAIGVPLAVIGWLPAWLAGIGMATSSLLVILNAARLSLASTNGSTKHNGGQ